MPRLSYVCCWIIILLGWLKFSLIQPADTISGKVSDGQNPISGAIIEFPANGSTALSDPEGNFEIKIENWTAGTLIYGGKEGYYNGTTVVNDPASKVEMVLTPLPAGGNKSYKWIDPTPNSGDPNDYHCGECHRAIYQQWLTSGHAKSASESIFLDIYNGWDATGNPFYQPGYRLDYPYSKGNCSNCHAPAAAIRNTIGVDINELLKVEQEGIICDFCHKIKDIQLKESKSVYTGIMQLKLFQPPQDEQLYLGPYVDSPRPYSCSPLISNSKFCAPCHEGSFWGVPIYETYSEWANSPYYEKNIHCQDCHMPPNGISTRIVETENALERDPSTIHSHLFKGTDDSSFLASAVEMSSNYEIKKDRLHLIVEIKNVGAGHSIPTGQPMRNLILVIEAKDSRGNKLEYIGENKIPVWGGEGDPEQGNYGGLPGKAFAKVLFEHYSQYVQLKLGVKWQHIFPAPQWRTVTIKMNSRIPALSSDLSSYDYKTTGNSRPFTITSKLFYRKTFKNWATMKRWKLKDILLAENEIHIK